MTIAYLITAYHRPKQLVRLVRRLDGPDTWFFVHFDARASREMCQEAATGLAGMANVTFVARERIVWSSPALAERVIAMVREALLARPEVSHVMWLSGQDYPLRHPAAVARFLAGQPGRSFAEFAPLDSENAGGRGVHRVRYWWFWILGKPLPFPLRWSFRYGWITPLWNAFVQLFPARRRYTPELSPHGGSSWWILSRTHAEEMLSYIDEHPRFLQFFRRSFISDEIVFSTLIAGSRMPELVTNDNLRFILWQRGSPHPNTLTMADLPAMRASGKLFARKFDEDIDPTVLDELDASLDEAAESPAPGEAASL
jgi:hypothetical protein